MGVCATPIFTLLIACTYFAHLGFGRTNPTTKWHHMIWVHNGAFSVSGTDWFADLSGYPPRLTYGWRVGMNYQRGFAALPTARWGKDGVRFLIPLWLPLLLLSVPTSYLWYTDRRAKPWQCRKFRYDLRGLDGGVCPECGKPIAELTESPPPSPAPSSTPGWRADWCGTRSGIWWPDFHESIAIESRRN